MSKSKITIHSEGMSTEDRIYLGKIKLNINTKLHELTLEYNKCQCDKCRIIVVNQMEDLVNAELYYWLDTLSIPSNQIAKIEDDALDHSLNMIFALQETISRFNELRKELMKD